MWTRLDLRQSLLLPFVENPDLLHCQSRGSESINVMVLPGVIHFECACSRVRWYARKIETVGKGGMGIAPNVILKRSRIVRHGNQSTMLNLLASPISELLQWLLRSSLVVISVAVVDTGTVVVEVVGTVFVGAVVVHIADIALRPLCW